MINKEPESVPLRRSEDTGRSKTISAVLGWAFLIIELLNGQAEQHEKGVIKLLHCGSFDMEPF